MIGTMIGEMIGEMQGAWQIADAPLTHTHKHLFLHKRA